MAKKPTYLEEMNDCFMLYGLCVDYYNAGGNPQYKVMKLQDGERVDYFSGTLVFRTTKRADIDSFLCGVAHEFYQQKERNNNIL